MTLQDGLTFGGIIIAAGLGFLGAWSSARASRSSAARTAELTAFQLQMDARDAQILTWRTDAELIRRNRDDNEVRADAQIAALEAKVDHCAVQLSALIAWAHTVAAIMREADIKFPAPPVSARTPRGKPNDSG